MICKCRYNNWLVAFNQNPCFLGIRELVHCLMHTLLHLYCSSSPHWNLLNSLWPSEAIWQYRSESTLALVMAWRLKALNHYWNQCWLIISEFFWHSLKEHFVGNAQDIYSRCEFANYWFKISTISFSGQLLKEQHFSQCSCLESLLSDKQQYLMCCNKFTMTWFYNTYLMWILPH